MLGLSMLAFVAPALTGQVDRIQAPLDDENTVTLSGETRQEARPENDRGAVDADTPLEYLTLLLQPAGDKQAELRQFLQGLQDPQSPDFHHWLTPEEFGERYGVSPKDLHTVSDWLQSEGFSIESTARGRGWIVFSGTAGQVASTFHTVVHRYEVSGKMHFANADAPSIPAVLVPVVSGIRGLDDFYPQPPRHHLHALYTSLSKLYTLAPSDFGMIYDVTPLWNAGIDGTGQSMVIVGASVVDMTDISTFRQTFGLPAQTPKEIPVGRNPPQSADNLVEADLDLEWAGAIAPNAALIYVYAPSPIDAAAYAIDNNLAPVISFSFGACELKEPQLAFRQLELYAQQANAQGITWVAASGDSGAAGCDDGAFPATHGLAVSVPASIPEVTGVGGTTLNYMPGPVQYWDPASAAALSYIPEMAWNDTLLSIYFGGTLSASGGGASAAYPQPYWQTGPGVPDNSARNVPDVTLAASPDFDPYVIVTQGQTTAVGGTSAATPTFSAILTLLNHYLVANGAISQPGLGNINPMLYGLAGNVPQAFHDIVTGNNLAICQINTPNCSNGTLGYQAGPGYDQVTGLGSVDVWQLVQNWNPMLAIAPPAP